MTEKQEMARQYAEAGFTQVEIANILSISQPAVAKLLQRAGFKLKANGRTVLMSTEAMDNIGIGAGVREVY